jgi:RNA polymerase sigma-70 factor, ECF subfamily
MISDAEGRALLESWRAGDREAGDRFVEAYFPAVLRFFRNKVPSDTEVDGLVGQTFENCLTTTAAYRGTGSLLAWILGVARFTMLHDFRRKRRDRSIEPLDEEFTSADIDPRDPATLLMQSDDLRLVLKALRRISLAQQTVIEMRVIEGMKLRDIAEAVAAPQPTVSRRWQLGLKALHVQMKLLESSPEEFAVSTHSLQSWIREVKERHNDSMEDPEGEDEEPEGEGD